MASHLRPRAAVAIRGLMFVLVVVAFGWACIDFGSVQAGQITAITNVSGDLPTGTWVLEIKHDLSGEEAERRIGPNQSQTFSSLQTTGTWDISVLDDGQLGPFMCDPEGGNSSTGLQDTEFTWTFTTTCVFQISADAGGDQIVDVGTVVTLDGTGSSGSSPTYTWSIVSAPILSASAITNAGAASASFLVDEPGEYTFRLTVSETGQSETDDVIVTTHPPTVTQLSPLSGPTGTAVTITGTNFSPTTSGNAVAFNGVAATFTAVSAQEIGATVPAAATTGVVTVTVLSTGEVATGPEFVVTAPVDPWTFVMPFDQADDYQSVSFASLSIGMTVGDGRKVLRTVDGGATWVPVTSIDATYGVPRRIAVPTAEVAYAAVPSVGTSTVLRTGDAGATWDPVRSESGEVILAVSFVDALEGWAVGNGGVVIHTGDGGATWEDQTSTVAVGLSDVFFVNNQFGVAISSAATVVRTTDGGATDWSATTLSGVAALRDLSFADASNGMIVANAAGGGPMVFTTTDGGANWNTVAHDLPTTMSLFAVSLATPSVAVVWGEDPLGGDAIYRSTNGGVNWVREAGTSPRDIRDIVMLSETTGVAVGLGAIFRRQ